MTEINRVLVVLCSEHVLVVFELEISYVVVAHACRFVVVFVVHLAGFRQIYYREGVFLFQKSIVLEAPVRNQLLEH